MIINGYYGVNAELQESLFTVREKLAQTRIPLNYFVSLENSNLANF
jgi:hypothetical protein